MVNKDNMVDKVSIVCKINIQTFQSIMAKSQELLWLKKSRARFFYSKTSLTFDKLKQTFIKTLILY